MLSSIAHFVIPEPITKRVPETGVFFLTKRTRIWRRRRGCLTKRLILCFGDIIVLLKPKVGGIVAEIPSDRAPVTCQAV